MSDLVQQAANKGNEIVSWLENREPADVLADVRRFAARRPVMFLALCGLAGVVAGRITRGAVAANTSVDSPSRAGPWTLSPATSPVTRGSGVPGRAGVLGAVMSALDRRVQHRRRLVRTTAAPRPDPDYTGTAPDADYTGTVPGQGYTGGATR